MSLRVWFLGVFFLARYKKGISALRFQKDTGVGSYQTAWALLHKLRSGLATLRAPLLKGDVEADETYIGGYRAGRNGRGAGKAGVAIVVERQGHTAGSARLVVIPRATTAVLTSFSRWIRCDCNERDRDRSRGRRCLLPRRCGEPGRRAAPRALRVGGTRRLGDRLGPALAPQRLLGAARAYLPPGRSSSRLGRSSSEQQLRAG